LKSEIADLARDIPQETAPAPEFARSELLQLRNVVGMARTDPPDLERLSEENRRLAREIQRLSERHVPLSEMDGYVPSDAWVESGLGSPEATLRSFCAAIERQDLRRITQCLTGASAEPYAALLKENDTEAKFIAISELRMLTQTKGYRLTNQRTDQAGQVTVELQVAPGGMKTGMVFRNVGPDWKLAELFRPVPSSTP
jgi:hypothetical protein